MPAGKKAKIFDSMLDLWAQTPQFADSTPVIEEDRAETIEHDRNPVRHG